MVVQSSAFLNPHQRPQHAADQQPWNGTSQQACTDVRALLQPEEIPEVYAQRVPDYSGLPAKTCRAGNYFYFFGVIEDDERQNATTKYLYLCEQINKQPSIAGL